MRSIDRLIEEKRCVLQKIENEASYRYEVTIVPDDLANCL